MHGPSAVDSLSSKAASSRKLSRSTAGTSSPKDSAEGAASPPPPIRLRDESNPSPLSSWFCARHHPSAPNEPATALQRARPTFVDSYLRDTPELRHLKHEVDQDLAPVTTPAAAALPRLVMNVPQSVTLLVGITLRAHIVCLRLPPEHSFFRRCRKFLQAETRSARLPLDVWFSRFGSVSD